MGIGNGCAIPATLHLVGAKGLLDVFAALAHMNIRVRGRATVGLLAAFAAAITNLHAGDRWRKQVPEPAPDMVKAKSWSKDLAFCG